MIECVTRRGAENVGKRRCFILQLNTLLNRETEKEISKKIFKKKKETRGPAPRNGEAVQWRSRDGLMLRCALGRERAELAPRARARVWRRRRSRDVKRGRVLARLRRVIVDNMVMNGVVFLCSIIVSNSY